MDEAEIKNGEANDGEAKEDKAVRDLGGSEHTQCSFLTPQVTSTSGYSLLTGEATHEDATDRTKWGASGVENELM